MFKSSLHLTINEGPKKGETLDRKAGAAIRIGRVVRGNTIAIRDPSISQKHLSLEFDPQISRWAVTDLDTSNGTAVNGVRIPSSAAFPLSDGDSVKIGEDTLISVKIVDLRVSATEDESGRGRRRNSVRVLKKDDTSDSVAPTNLRRGRSGKCSGDSKTGKALGTFVERGRRDSLRVLKKDEISDSVAPTKLRRGRSRNCLRDSKVDEALSAALDRGRRIRGVSDSVSKIDQVSDTVVDSVIDEDKARAPKNLPRGRRRNSSRVSKTAVADTSEEPTSLGSGKRGILAELSRKDEALVPAAEDNIDVPKNLGRGRKSTRTQILKNDGNSSRVLKADENEDDIVDTAVADSCAAPVSLRKGRRGGLAKVSKKTEALGSAEDDNMDLPKMLGRGRRSTRTQILKNDVNSSRVSKTDGNEDDIVDTAVADSYAAPVRLRKGRRGALAKVSKKTEGLGLFEDENIDVPNMLGRGRSTRTQNLMKVLDAIVDTKIKAPQKLRRGRSGLNTGAKKEGSLDSVSEGSNQVPKNAGRRKDGSSKGGVVLIYVMEDSSSKVSEDQTRGSRIGSSHALKKNEALDSVSEGSNQVPKNVGRRKDDSSKDGVVLSSVMEDSSSKVSEDQTRGSRIGSSQASKKNEALDSVAENRTVKTTSSSRGKIRSSSTRFANKDGTMDSHEESVQVGELGKGRPIRGMARRTRAAYARLSKKECLESDDPVLKSVKVPKGNSNQIGKSEDTHHMSPRESKEGQNRDAFDKENYSCITSELNEATMRSTSVPDVEGLTSGNIANSAEPSKRLPKIWNGNGIPNTTTKYKEDSKVSWHRTPFEERVEKALSGDKVFLQSS